VDRIATLDETIDEAKRRAGIRPGAKTEIVEYPRRPFVRLPSFLRRSVSAPGRTFGANAEGLGAAETPTYEARTLQWILDRPGQPLLMTPGSVLPVDEEALP